MFRTNGCQLQNEEIAMKVRRVLESKLHGWSWQAHCLTLHVLFIRRDRMPATLSRFTWPDGKTFEGFYAKDVKAKRPSSTRVCSGFSHEQIMLTGI